MPRQVVECRRACWAVAEPEAVGTVKEARWVRQVEGAAREASEELGEATVIATAAVEVKVMEAAVVARAARVVQMGVVGTGCVALGEG